MSGVACAIGAAAVIGAGATMYGAAQNKKALAAAQKSNDAKVDATNAQNLAMFRESRGLDSNGNAINANLPSWMTVRVNKASAKRANGTYDAVSTPFATPRDTSGLFGSTSAKDNSWMSGENSAQFLTKKTG